MDLVEDNYLTCKGRKNRPQIRIEVCMQCKKKVGCKAYIHWLEMHTVIEECTAHTKELHSVRETALKTKEKPRPKINVFEWKD